jgi:hypothetical protein
LVTIQTTKVEAGDIPENALHFSMDGWVEGGTFLSLYGRQGTFNYGPTDAASAQEVNLNQLYFINTMDLDLGGGSRVSFRVDNLVGTDWNIVAAYGFLQGAFKWNEIGWDLPQAFFAFDSDEHDDGGLHAQIGKVFTPYGYEDVQATERPLYSTGYLYNFIYPSTQTGFMVEWAPVKGITLYQGILNAPDVSLSQFVRVNYLAGIQYDADTPLQQEFAFYVNYGQGLTRMNQLMMTGTPNDPPMELESLTSALMSNILMLSETMTIELTESTTLSLDLTQGLVNGSQVLDGSGPGNSGSWLGGGAWITHKLTQELALTFRLETLNSSNRIATGYTGTLLEETLGVAYSPLEVLVFRPEVRYDHAFGSSPFLQGTSQQLFSLNMDAILKF